MDKETREYLDRKFSGIDEKFVGIDLNFVPDDDKLEDIKRYFGVVSKGLRNEIRQVAEGHEVIRSEIKTFRNEVKENLRRLEHSSSSPIRNWIRESGALRVKLPI